MFQCIGSSSSLSSLNRMCETNGKFSDCENGLFSFDEPYWVVIWKEKIVCQKCQQQQKWWQWYLLCVWAWVKIREWMCANANFFESMIFVHWFQFYLQFGIIIKFKSFRYIRLLFYLSIYDATLLQLCFFPLPWFCPYGLSSLVVRNRFPFKLRGTAKPIGKRRPGHSCEFNAVSEVHLLPMKFCSLPG